MALQKAAPCLRQAEKSQRMPGWRGVENDMIEASPSSAKSDVNSSNAAISVVQAPDNCSRTVERSRHWLRRPFAPGLDDDKTRPPYRGRCSRQTSRPPRYWRRRVAELNSEHLVEVRCGVGADEQHGLAGVRQRERRGGRERRLSNAAFACEEKMAGWVDQKTLECGHEDH